MNLKCPICETNIEISDTSRKGERVTCTNCYAQLAMHLLKKEPILACAICKEPVFDPANCGDCERRKERKRIIDEGTL
jgi:primosomal protein N'